MNLAELKEKVSPYFPNVEDVEDGILKASCIHNNNKYKIAYFDINKNFLKPNFDIEIFQRNLLAEDYYSYDDYIRSNFYLYFLFDDNKLINNDFFLIKNIIENNKTLARKYIVNIEDLDEELSYPSFKKSESIGNIIDEWSAVIGEEHIHVLDENISKKESVKRILYGEDGPERAAPKPSYLRQEIFDPIEELTFINYRKYPINRKFNFGKVNLICGPNASGKTSLLEAIELAICGKTIRNHQIDEDFKFELKHIGENNKITITKKSDKHYRSLDYHWYGRTYRQGNYLYNSFSRFNFFDADAAVKYAERFSDDEININEIFASIVLGPDAQFIFKRVDNIYNTLKDKKKKSKNNIDQIIIEKNKLIKELEESKFTKIDESTKALILTEIKNTLNFELEDDYIPQLKIKLSELEIALKIWKKAIDEYDITDYGSFKKIEKNIDDSIKKINKLNKDKLKLKENINATNIDKLTKRLKNLTRLKEYYDTDSYKMLVYSEKRKLLDTNLKLYKIALKNKNKYIFDVEKSMLKMDINDAYKQIQNNIEDIQNSITSLKTDITNLQESNTLSQNFVAQIRNIGKKYAELNPNETQCPLCDSDLKPSILIERIKSLSSGLSMEDSILEGKLNKLSELEAKHALQNKYFDFITYIKTFCDDLNIKSVSKSVSELLSIINESEKLMHNNIKEFDTIDEKIKTIESHGYNTEELNELLEFIYGDREYSNISLNTILIDIDNCNKDIIKNKKTIKSNEDKIVSINNEIEKYKNTNKSLMIKDINLLNDVKDRYDHYQNEVISINNIIKLNEITTYNTVENIFNIITNHLKQLSDSEIGNEYITSLNKKIEDYVNEAKEEKKLIERASDVIKKLDTLTEDLSPTAKVSNFFSNYNVTISSIFKRIHAPREFSGIDINDTKEFLVIKHDSDESLPLSMMSTGQRSALILSVFLSLNNIVNNAPKLILLDDPVTYVDDLNMLSFLDFIQKMVMNEDKQIFFSTASNKIASIFEKKFNYMSNDSYGFKKFELARTEEIA